MSEQRIVEAFWETRDRGIAVLARDWTDNERMPPLLLDPGRQNLKLVRRVEPFVFGRRAGYCLSGREIVFILWPKYFPNLLWEEETLYVAGDFNGWSEAVGKPEWRMHQETHDGQGCLVLRAPRELCVTDKPVRFKFVTAEGRWQELPGEAPNRVRTGDFENYLIEPLRTGLHLFHFWPQDGHDVMQRHWLVWKDDAGEDSCPVTNTEFLLSLGSEQPMGVVVERKRTVFRIFAPRAARVSVCLYAEAEGLPWQRAELERRDDGSWETSLPLNLNGYYYDYRVEGDNFGQTRHFIPSARILDPYAQATVGRAGPGIIMDMARQRQPKQCFIAPSWHDLVMVEAHVRDLLAKAPMDLSPEERRGFKGLTRWLRRPDCYLKKLGVNAVELQPVQEFDNERPEDYHWGYMPVNFFSPASAYGTRPERGSQVEEFREAVEAFHEAGIAVILDVVYNHVGEPNHLIAIDKFYYLWCDHDGRLSNWSGCGNDLRCDTPMGRRLIRDSLIHLIQTYDVDGFRFDLADLVGVGVLTELEKELKAVKPSIILIAEPWSFRGHIGQALKRTGISSWNDGFREFVTQYVTGQGNPEGMQYFLMGSPGNLTRFPAQTVNYVQSHDDFAWLDRITENPAHQGDPPTLGDVRRHHLMVAILMASLGIPMLAQGQDMMHSKHGVNNTYLRGDLNALDYAREEIYPETVAYFREWIRFRLSCEGRHFRQHTHPSEGYFGHFGVPGTSAVGLLYNADFSQGPDRLFFAINPHPKPLVMETYALEAAQFRQIANQEIFHLENVQGVAFAWHDGRLILPPMSVGLWRQG